LPSRGFDAGRGRAPADPALAGITFRALLVKVSAANAGMGDTIFVPAYEALRNRGVDIQFFHRVKTLELSPDRSRIERISHGDR
jgi:uncharacterized protein with NAD-binding domain and iron-sulfur cluster